MKAHASAAAVMAAFLFCVPHHSPAHAETTLCTEITALPFTITVQGVYCLKKNLNVNLSAFDNAAITINTGNVTIDFNGFRVNNQAPLATNQAIGVYAADRNNIKLRNGFIRGFAYGISLAEDNANAAGSHLVEDMRIADSGRKGIWVEGDGSIVRDNVVINTGGGSIFTAIGIHLSVTDDGVVSDNIIAGASETSESYGLYVNTSNRVMVSGNLVRNVDGGTDRAIGLFEVDHTIIAGNKLLNNPGTGTAGIFDLGVSDNVVCRDNESAGFTATPFTGCDVNVGNVIDFN